VLTQDFTGVPAIVDLAAMRDASDVLGRDSQLINPPVRVELMTVTASTSTCSASRVRSDATLSSRRTHRERYAFLRWGQTFSNLPGPPPTRDPPPGHLECLAVAD
jgi:aconitate hydratase